MVPKLKILIVEDDFSFAVEMEMQLKKLGYEVLTTVNNVEQAKQILESDDPDLVITDIFLKGINDGIHLGELLKKREIPLIFITQSKDFKLYERAKKAAPVSYLVKPFDRLTLQHSIENAFYVLSLKQQVKIQTSDSEKEYVIKDSFFIRNNKILNRVFFSEINWVQSEGNYSMIHTDTKKYVIKLSLAKLIQRLPNDNFLRIHQRYIVQIDKIKNIDVFENSLQIDGQTFPIGRTYREIILNKINKL